MIKKSTIFLLLTINILSEEAKQIQIQKTPTDIPAALNEIADDVRSIWHKLENEIELNYKKTYETNDIEQNFSNVKASEKTLKMGTEVLDRVNKYLIKPELKKHVDLKKAQNQVKTAQTEHDKAKKLIDSIKKSLIDFKQQIKNQMDQLRKAMEKVNEKSKIAIEKSQPILQKLSSV